MTIYNQCPESKNGHNYAPKSDAVLVCKNCGQEVAA